MKIQIIETVNQNRTWYHIRYKKFLVWMNYGCNGHDGYFQTTLFYSIQDAEKWVKRITENYTKGNVWKVVYSTEIKR